MEEYKKRYTSLAAYAAEQNLKLNEKVIKNKENKIKKTAEEEIKAVNTMTEKMVKKANSWLYSKKEKESLREDIKVNEEYVSYLSKSSGGFNFEEELLRQKEERERLAKIEKEKQEQTKEQELKKDIIISNNEQKQENQDFGRDKNKEMQLDEFSQELGERLSKSRGFGFSDR